MCAIRLFLCFCAVLVVIVSGQRLSFDNETEMESSRSEESNEPVSSRASAVDPLRRCDVTFSDPQFYFSSPDYPQPYSNNLDCVVTVKRSRDVCRLRLVFQVFDVQPSDGCLSDFLQIQDDRLCGTLPSETSREYSFTGSDLRLRFHTDAFGTARGFFVRSEQVPCGGSEGQCDVLVDQQQFDITNRNWPQNSALDCTFTLRKFSRDVCTLHLIFVVLDLNCQFEYLEIDRRRFCSQPKDQFQVVDFLGTDFVIRFHSDRMDPSSRLLVRVIQRMCRPLEPAALLPSKAVVCLLNPEDGGTTTSARNFLLRSPPFPYLTNADCIYEFLLEATPNCNSNFLSIGNERLCGSLPQGSIRVFEFLSDEIPIRFVANSIPPGRGFALSVWQRNCEPGFNCDALYTTGSFVFWSTPVPPSSVCTYTVSKAGSHICSLRLHFQVFDFGPVDPSCSQSFLDVKGDRLCARFVEGTTRTYSFDGPNIRIRYHAGFGSPRFRVAALQRPCGRDPPNVSPSCEKGSGFDASSFSKGRLRLRSSGYPLPLSSFVDCVYVVRRTSPLVCQLRLDFIDFDLEASDRCSDQFLQINDVKFCGNEAAGTKKSFDFVGPELYIRFRSGPNKKSVSFERRGFFLEGDQLECYTPTLPLPPPTDPSQCCRNRTIQSSEVTLTVRPESPSTFCVYTIYKYRPDICNIEVEFLSFWLRKSKSQFCEDHFLEIGGRRHCGSIPSGTVKRYEFATDVFVVAYRSGGGFSDGGFSIRIRQIPCLELPVNLIQRDDNLETSQRLRSPPFGGCDVVYTETSFYWTSPSFPGQYGDPVSADCVLTLKKTNWNVCRLFVVFLHLDVEFSDGCSKDYLQITSERFCGHISTPFRKSFTFRGDSTVLRFHSDGFDSKRGFDIYVEQESCDQSPRVTTNWTSYQNMKWSS